jgi:hypothetical protein
LSSFDDDNLPFGGSPTLGGQKDLGGSPMTIGSPEPDPKLKPSKLKKRLDSENDRKTLRQLEEWFEVERIRQAPNRYQMAIDSDFYDGLQWADEDAQELALRGQAPLVYNKVQPAVKWITGTEKRTRIDWKILPRDKAGINDADVKTKVMKYLQDVNKSEYTRSRAFEDAVKVGVGWLECGIRGDPTMEPIYDRMESWRNVIYDSQGMEYDLSDCRYMFRHKWVDQDISIALFPESAAAIKTAAVYSDFTDAQDNEEWYLGQVLQERSADGSVLNRRTFVDTSTSLFNRRARVKLYEAWYRKPTKIQYIHAPGHKLHNKEFNPNDPAMLDLQANEVISLYDRVGMKMWCAIFIRGQLLQNMPSPYAHNDFPWTPVWGNRRGRDNAPYGMVRVIRDPQEDFNKRMSKALHSLSTRRVLMEEDAVSDIEELRDEVARPDSVIQYKVGKKIEIQVDTEIAEEHVKYAQIDEKMIQDLSGVTDDLMGRKSNATSGIAIERRQDQGSTVTTDFFDNLRLATQLHGQKILSLSKQYMTAQQEIRVTGVRPGEDFITINEQKFDSATGQSSVLNDITASEADFVVSETDYRASARQAMAETLAGLVSKMPPNIAMLLLDDVVELWDIPGTDEIVRTIRAATGKPDPNKRMSPEEQKAMAEKQAQQQQMQEEMQQLGLQTAQANLAKLEGAAAELNAKAQKIGAETQQIGVGDGGASDNLATLQKNTDSVVFELRKQLMEARGQFENLRAKDNAKVTAEQIKAQTILDKTDRDNAVKLEIAAINDRTLEATKGLAAQIDGLDDDLKAIEQGKVDKPTPQEEAQEMIDQNQQETADQQDSDADDETIAELQAAVKDLTARMKQLSKPKSKPAAKK